MIAYSSNKNNSGTYATMHMSTTDNDTTTYSNNVYAIKTTEKIEIEIIKNLLQKFYRILKFSIPLSFDNKRARKNNRQMLIKRQFNQGINESILELLILLLWIRI